MYKSQFKDKRFKTSKDFNNFVEDNCYANIYLKDFGQDMQLIRVHETGEILKTDFNSEIYIGKFVNMNKLKLDSPIKIFSDEENSFITYNGLVLDEIIF